MNFPLSFETRNLPTFLFTFSLGFIFLLGYNIGKVLQDMLEKGYSHGLLFVLILFIILLLFGLYAFVKSMPMLRKKELLSDKLLEEQIVKEVIDQDYKLMQMRVLEKEHNMKVKEWNEKHPNQKFEEFNWRNIEGIAKQALDSNFYEKTYGFKIMGNKKQNNK